MGLQGLSRAPYEWFTTALVGIALAAPSCKPPPPAPVTISVHARTETGAPTGNVEIYAGPRLIARTDANGRAQLSIDGAEGETFELRVKCPPGFSSPAKPVVVRRLGISATTAVPEHVVSCHQTRHALVVAVRAEGGPGLPVLHLGKLVARTDATGAAHVLLEGEVREHVELTIGTPGKENEKIHPQNPAQVFEVPERDSIQLFAVTFTRDPKKAPIKKSGPKGPTPF